MGPERVFLMLCRRDEEGSLAKKAALAGYPAGPKSIAAEASIKGLQKRIDVGVIGRCHSGACVASNRVSLQRFCP